MESPANGRYCGRGLARPVQHGDPRVITPDLIDSLRCPFCKKGDIKLTQEPPKTRLECASCRRFIEGKMQQD